MWNHIAWAPEKMYLASVKPRQFSLWEEEFFEKNKALLKVTQAQQ